MTAPDGRTYHDPAAEASARVFESAVDAFALAQGKASTARLNLMADRFEREAERDTARAALIAAHAAAVADADAVGYARALAEVDARRVAGETGGGGESASGG